MIPIDSQPILTAAQMRAAEEQAIAAGSSVEQLMECAGAGIADVVCRLAAGAPVLILCGPGNNGGDGYVAAGILAARGVDVSVAAGGDPSSEVAIRARAVWNGDVTALDTASPRPIVVDSLFGTGLSRRIDDTLAAQVDRLQRDARLTIAVDLPSGIDCDTGALLRSSMAPADITLALGAVKPAHVLAPAAELCGAVRVIDLGIAIPADGNVSVIQPPFLAEPNANSTKYNRGMVAVIGGTMPGAAVLAAEAAMRSGAGYVLLLADQFPTGSPHALVCRAWSAMALMEERIGAVLVGPGLGRDDTARAKLDAALASGHAIVIDGDALHLLGDLTFHDRARPVILTPHAGEFKAMVGEWAGSKITATRDAAIRLGAVVVFKGSDTVIADKNGKVVVAPNGSSWLSTAGTGDVLAGMIAAQLAAKVEPIQAAATGVWLHGEAARRLGRGFIADDLAWGLRAVGQAR